MGVPWVTPQHSNAQAWSKYECKPESMTLIDFGPDRIRVAPPTIDPFHALASVLQSHGYQIRVDDTDSYNCRAIKGGPGRSLHSYGIAVDVNWDTNPFKLTPDNRRINFSDKSTQRERGEDVKHGKADTDFTPEIIKDVLAIKTKEGKTVFEWGGHWTDRKDAMHFELDVTPEELAAGLDWNTVKRSAPIVITDHVGDGNSPSLLSADTIRQIIALADASPLLRYRWQGRGIAPSGYIKGMCVTFAL